MEKSGVGRRHVEMVEVCGVELRKMEKCVNEWI